MWYRNWIGCTHLETEPILTIVAQCFCIGMLRLLRYGAFVGRQCDDTYVRLPDVGRHVTISPGVGEKFAHVTLVYRAL